MGFATAYTRILQKYRYFILFSWLALFGVSAWLGPKFLSRTVMGFAAPPNAPASIAQDLLLDAFPNQRKTTEFAIYVWSKYAFLLLFEMGLIDNNCKQG